MKMKLKVFTFYDSAAKAYTQPFQMQNEALAMRAFMDNVNSQNESNMTLHPDQFTLYQVAEFDDQTGTYEPLKNKKMLAVGSSLVTQTEEAELKVMIQKLLDKLEEK